MDRDDLCAIVAILLVFFAGFVAGAVGATISDRKEAIERGFAEYDAKTGEWKWKGE